MPDYDTLCVLYISVKVMLNFVFFPYISKSSLSRLLSSECPLTPLLRPCKLTYFQIQVVFQSSLQFSISLMSPYFLDFLLYLLPFILWYQMCIYPEICICVAVLQTKFLPFLYNVLCIHTTFKILIILNFVLFIF